MIEELLWRLVENPKRKQAVIIGTILTALVVLWPAADEYMAARERVRTAQSELEESQSQVDKLPQFMQMFEKRRDELKKLEKMAVSEKTAQNLRNELVQIVRETNCKMRRIRLGDPMKRMWMENDHPVDNLRIIDKGAETPFQLEIRQMSISITGTMSNIRKFLAKLHDVERFVHTKSIALKRNSGTNETALDIDVLLFDLARKAS